MDIVVKWNKNGKENTVSSKDVQIIGKGTKLLEGRRVQMDWYGSMWEGTVSAVNVLLLAEDSDDDDEPLAKLRKTNGKQHQYHK